MALQVDFLLVLSASTCAWSRLALHMLGIWCLSWKKSGNKWYVAYEGRPVPNAEGEQELEKRAAVFRTSASFWESGQMMCGARPPTQKR